MAGFGFSYGKSAAEWNVLLYLWWLGVGSTPLRASRRTLYANFEKQNLKNNLKIVRTITNTKKVPKMFVLNGQN